MCKAILRPDDFYRRIVVLDEFLTFCGFLAKYHSIRLLEHYAKKRTYSGRTATDDQDCVILFYFGYPCCPESGRKHITDQQCLLIAHCVRYLVQSLIRIRHTYIFRLTSINPAAERPSSICIRTVIHIAVSAEEAFAAECLNIYRNSVARPYRLYFRSDFRYDSHHFMADGYTLHRPGNTAMLDVQVAGTYTAESDFDNCILWVDNLRNGLINQLEMSMINICVCFHEKTKI